MTKLPAYPHLDGLVDLACRDGVDIRPTLLRVLTDLYVQKPSHSADEERQYTELALGLIGSVDDTTRAAVAASLAHYPAAPATVLSKLGYEAAEPEAPAGDLNERFFAADSDTRRTILATLGSPAEARSTATPVAGELVRRLENAALQRNTGEFSRVLERALGLGPALADRIARDTCGEPIVIAAKALGMTAAAVQRVLLFLNPAIGQSVQRVHDLARLFDELAPETAEHIVDVWRGTAARQQHPSAPGYEPVHWDDERRRARSQATSMVRRKVSRSGDRTTRDRISGR